MCFFDFDSRFCFSMRLTFYNTKWRWPRATSFLSFSRFHICIACDILRKFSAGSRRWSFWQTIPVFYLCFQPLPDGTFFPKTMLAFLFFSFQRTLSKNVVFFLFFGTKSWTKPKWLIVFWNHLQRNSPNTSIHNPLLSGTFTIPQ